MSQFGLHITLNSLSMKGNSMSTEEDKFKHSKRLHKEEVVIKRQIKIAETYGMEVKDPHKFAKHHALNCGNPKCIMCMNPRKSMAEKTIQEQKLEQPKLYDEGV
jgi:hypothetical protein